MQLADKLASSIANRQQLLKLLAMNNYDMEANSRPELLASFKVAYDTDYILVKEENYERALNVLESEGYTIV